MLSMRRMQSTQIGQLATGKHDLMQYQLQLAGVLDNPIAEQTTTCQPATGKHLRVQYQLRLADVISNHGFQSTSSLVS